MSKFFSKKYASLEAYTPGEQPRDQQYVKLNTNESPFPPAPEVVNAATEEAGRLQLYSDPESTNVTRAVAARYGVQPENVLMVNGSDEILNFAFMAFGDEEHPFVFPDISYGFYPVYAELHGIEAHPIPLRQDFSIDPSDFMALDGFIAIANPNAPTGLLLSVDQIEQIVASNPDHVVIIDEAYIDFGGESCIPLIRKYDNLLVTQTFSKSRSLAGGRLGYGIGSAALIRDLNTIKYSTNPYNVNRMTAACGKAAIEADDYYQKNAKTIAANRAFTTSALRARDFEILPSAANFIFVKPPFCSGEELYLGLKQRGVLIRHWNKPRISPWCRITIGTLEQMQALLHAIDKMMEESK